MKKNGPSLTYNRQFQDFLADFRNLLYFCYRKDFPPIDPSNITNDIGWGCMLRTGQMMLARCLMVLVLGRDYRVTPSDKMNAYSSYRQLLRWFADSPKFPYSIHNIVKESSDIDSQQQDGGKTSNQIGEWFSPTRLSQCLKVLVRKHSPHGLTMYVGTDGVIYKDKVTALCAFTEEHEERSPLLKRMPSKSTSESTKINNDEDCVPNYWRPVFIIIPLRLGVDKINQVYISGLRAMFALPQSLGIVGGRPRQSLYFVGFQDDQVIYLDPHIVKPSFKPGQEFSADSYHCAIPQKNVT